MIIIDAQPENHPGVAVLAGMLSKAEVRVVVVHETDD